MHMPVTAFGQDDVVMTVRLGQTGIKLYRRLERPPCDTALSVYDVSLPFDTLYEMTRNWPALIWKLK